MFDPPRVTFDDCDVFAFVTETDAEPIVADVAERAEKALPFAVARTGWLSSLSTTRASAARRRENCIVKLEPATMSPTTLITRPPVFSLSGLADKSHAIDASPADMFGMAAPT